MAAHTATNSGGQLVIGVAATERAEVAAPAPRPARTTGQRSSPTGWPRNAGTSRRARRRLAQTPPKTRCEPSQTPSYALYRSGQPTCPVALETAPGTCRISAAFSATHAIPTRPRADAPLPSRLRIQRPATALWRRRILAHQRARIAPRYPRIAAQLHPTTFQTWRSQCRGVPSRQYRNRMGLPRTRRVLRLLQQGSWRPLPTNGRTDDRLDAADHPTQPLALARLDCRLPAATGSGGAPNPLSEFWPT